MVSNPYLTEVLARAHADDLVAEARNRVRPDQAARICQAAPKAPWRHTEPAINSD